MAKIRKGYNQVPHITQDITCESSKNTINMTNKGQMGQPIPSRCPQGSNEQTGKHGKHKHKNTNDPQKKYRLGTVS